MIYLKVLLSAVLVAVFLSVPAQAEEEKALKYYNYAHNEAEYAVKLPQAPMVRTIWGEEGYVPYLRNPPRYGALGEVAVFKQVDINTEEVFEVEIHFLKTDKKFLSWLNEIRMQKVLKGAYRTVQLTDGKLSFSEGTVGLKWAILTGFSVEQNRPIFNAMHYLTGQQSILVIKIRYNVQNLTFQKYYETLIKSITYYRP